MSWDGFQARSCILDSFLSMQTKSLFFAYFLMVLFLYVCSEDIGMTVRLVVNCNGMKVNTVRE